jgi:hypothetical protein
MNAVDMSVGRHMPAVFDSVVSVLFVEPHIYAQLELLHAAQDARVPLALSCVATCGGARDALESAEFDCLLLSTNLRYANDDGRALAALVQAARSRGITVLAFGPGDLEFLGLPVHESLSFGELSAAVRR